MLHQLALPAIPLLLDQPTDMVERTLAVSTDPEQLLYLDLLLLDMEMPTMGLQEEIIILLLDMETPGQESMLVEILLLVLLMLTKLLLQELITILLGHIA